MSSPPADGTPQRFSPWADVIGPCYTISSFGRVLGLSRAAVADAAAELTVLRLATRDGVDLFPAIQVRDGRVHPDFRLVLRTLRSGVDDPWTWVQWLIAEGWGEQSAMERLWAGGLEVVLRDAAHDAWAWRS